MRFLLDENVDVRVGDYLTALEHDVTAVARDYPRSIGDAVILDIAHREARVVITDDRDFGELVVRYGQPHAGVILFRLPAADLDTRIARLQDVLAHYADRLDHLVVVTARSIRLRSRTGS